MHLKDENEIAIFDIIGAAMEVHSSFRNHFSVKMRQFFNQPRVLHRHRSWSACSLSVLIVGYKPAVFCSKPVGILLR